MDWINLLICIASGYFLYVTIFNVLYLRIESQSPKQNHSEMVTIMVPARNEEGSIKRCVESLLNQNYKNYEVLVMNDNSTDKTGEILENLQKKYSHLHVYNGNPLKEGWFGKPYALQQLSQYAKGDYYLFSDADTEHSPESLSFCMTNMKHHKSDLLSAYPFQKLSSFGEVLNVTAMYLMTSLILPLWAVDHLKLKQATFCLGQYFFIKASVFKKINGFEAVKHELSEDIAFGKYIKKLGYRTKFLDASSVVTCHMYGSFIESFKGIGKNVYNAIGRNPLMFAGIHILIFLVIEYPFFKTVYELLTPSPLTVTTALSTLFFYILYFINTIDRRLPWYTFLLYPIQVFNIWLMAIYFLIRKKRGSAVIWKGRQME